MLSNFKSPEISTLKTSFKCSSGRGSLVVKVTDLWLACHEFEPSTTEDLPYRGAMHVKSVESSNILPLVWCGNLKREMTAQRCRPRHLTVVQNYEVRHQKPSCS
ncbi:uncharacterized protein TNCV_673381 [Trichonephila clavipes]|uniref:Uncharacterized protein n=1 Tax=Trichonephila clavipes TaxID=2585209 RepID=A0A8X7BIP0_TRICX|nr:uncharacterized protein TNCV_673381 [Trichonephila clavipes]